MKYTSTRDSSLQISSAEAIVKGISPDGGLFVPTEFPKVDGDFIASLTKMNYKERAKAVLSLFLTDFSEDEISGFVEKAYSEGKFESHEVAPLKILPNGVSFLELWKGPTCAFKDMALQLLPHLLTGSAKKIGDDSLIVILTATSGDTGKAALEGFKDVEGTKILVFYPSEGVSDIQKLQMATQEGGNVGVAAIYGNFDDAQSGVKDIFGDKALEAELLSKNIKFSSANSINWGRLVPQIVYYFSAYCDLVNRGKVKYPEKINICVPTGNFGNILAAYYAMRMGLPVNKLICASNRNNILTDFIKTGVYDRNREFFTTTSPSMDILISSNLERLLYELSGRDDAKIKEWFTSLKENGKYEVSPEVLNELKSVFESGYCGDEETAAEIKRVYDEFGYLIDTHTAVGSFVYENYRKTSGDDTPVVIASTASPYKFCSSVLSALEGRDSSGENEFEIMRRLEKLTNTAAPKQLKNLEGVSPRFTEVYDKKDMRQAVFSMLNI
ncbi:MAG TPA: threonine synthase [Clostridiales bacterium]|jgi:threonine synthase|nr:threonine synthase [Clostridiales bacterium]HOJ35868.1 threonine synthase [Clostridiales bacterium]HOL78553.1 threonine synthase [Clostridiales bacterium]HPP68224.1 threonine synthase [Clostridiales bacterium]HPU66863.1 threonine synthase [Clostridiales bacterium]